MSEIIGEMGRTVSGLKKKTIQTQLPGTIRKKYPGTGYSGTGPIYRKSLQDPKYAGAPASAPEGSVGTKIAQTLSGTVRKSQTETIEDSKPISTNTSAQKTGKNQTSNVPDSYEAGNLWAEIKSGLTTYAPALMVIAAVVLGIVIVKSAGNRRR